MPFYRYSFEVPLPPDAVAEKIRAVTGEWPPAWKRLWVRYTDPGSEIFWGGVDGNGFRLQRIIRRSRNSFEPLISGRIEPFGAGSRVSITMFFRPATAIFIALYLLVSAGFFLLFRGDSQGAFVTAIMFLFGLLLSGNFFVTVVQVKKQFRSLLPQAPGSSG